MSVPTHPNEDEYSAQLMVSTTKHYRFQYAEIADMKAGAGNKPAVVRLPFTDAGLKRASAYYADRYAFGAHNSVELY